MLATRDRDRGGGGVRRATSAEEARTAELAAADMWLERDRSDASARAELCDRAPEGHRGHVQGGGRRPCALVRGAQLLSPYRGIYTNLTTLPCAAAMAISMHNHIHFACAGHTVISIGTINASI